MSYEREVFLLGVDRYNMYGLVAMEMPHPYNDSKKYKEAYLKGIRDAQKGNQYKYVPR